MHAILNRPSRLLQIEVAMLALALASPVQADIFQWEYINPADPSLGKQQSATLTPDGAGVDAVPDADLSFRNLTMAYLIGADLRDAFLWGATLTDADFAGANVGGADFTKGSLGCDVFICGPPGTGITLAQLYSTANYQAHDLTAIGLRRNYLSSGNFAGQNLTNARFGQAILTDADFTDAELTGADFYATGITLAQLYSAASYKVHDLTGIGLGGNDLSGGNFVGQTLSNANFSGATLTDADFTDAEVRGASFFRNYCLECFDPRGTGISLGQLYSTASCRAHDLRGIDLTHNELTGGDFTRQNLANANFSEAYLTDADFNGAEIRGAKFDVYGYYGGTGITLAQLYSTASYQVRDLSGISLIGNYHAGGDFTGQNLTNANFTNAFLTDADFTGADARGAFLWTFYASEITTNLIGPDGHVSGVDLDAGGLLVVRDDDVGSLYDPDAPPIPITVDQHLAMGPGGTLRMEFEADAWDSTISFAPGIPVTLGGTLELTFAVDADLASQLGRTLDLFDWTGVNPTGAFAVSSPYAWDLSNLYTTGQITFTAVPEPSALALLPPVLCLDFYRRRRIR
jgi:uncharacterized protein YjbI with pentapeptide repeats